VPDCVVVEIQLFPPTHLEVVAINTNQRKPPPLPHAKTGQFQFSITASDSGSTRRTETVNYTLQVTGVAITTTSLPGAVAGVPYTATLTATGGTPPYKWDAPNPSAVPSGFSLSQDGVLSGTYPILLEGTRPYPPEFV